jgi:hypothetical protein
MNRTIDRRKLTLAVAAAALVPAFAILRPRSIEAQESSPTASPAASPSASPVAGGNEVEIGAYDIYFDPKEVTIKADTETTIKVPNHGVTLHTFLINDHKNENLPFEPIKLSIDPGKTEEAKIKPQACGAISPRNSATGVRQRKLSPRLRLNFSAFLLLWREALIVCAEQSAQRASRERCLLHPLTFRHSLFADHLVHRHRHQAVDQVRDEIRQPVRARPGSRVGHAGERNGYIARSHRAQANSSASQGRRLPVRLDAK